jgi:hypothetical protein
VEATTVEVAAAQVPEVESLLGQVAERANRQKSRRPAAPKGKTPRRTQGAVQNGPATFTPPAEPEPPAVAKDPFSTD